MAIEMQKNKYCTFWLLCTLPVRSEPFPNVQGPSTSDDAWPEYRPEV